MDNPTRPNTPADDTEHLEIEKYKQQEPPRDQEVARPDASHIELTQRAAPSQMPEQPQYFERIEQAQQPTRVIKPNQLPKRTAPPTRPAPIVAAQPPVVKPPIVSQPQPPRTPVTSSQAPIVPSPMPASVPSPVSSALSAPVAPLASAAPPASVQPVPFGPYGQRSPASVPPAPRARSSRQDGWKWAMLAVIAFGGTLLAGLAVFLGIRFANVREEASTGVNGTNTFSAAIITPTTGEAVTVPTTLLPTATVGVQIEPWNGTERFTLLLLGLDKRPNDQGTAFRTDSMILVSIDPKTHSIGMLSIPRDLYVEIPRDTVVRSSYGLQRVNSAYPLAEQVQQGYGPKLAMQTVQYNLGIRVHDYIVYDFEAVIAGIDAVGGLDIDVPRNIVDNQYPDMYGGYDPLNIKAGRQHMDGTLALKYARTRHDSSDFDRAKRQQQVLTAIRDKVLNLNMVPELVVRAPGLWSQLSRHVRSGLTFDQLIRLALYAKDVPLENIHQGVIDVNYVQPVRWNGADVLVPNRASIGPLLVQVFGSNYNN